jgi:hypothetical protein
LTLIFTVLRLSVYFRAFHLRIRLSEVSFFALVSIITSYAVVVIFS